MSSRIIILSLAPTMKIIHFIDLDSCIYPYTCGQKTTAFEKQPVAQQQRHTHSDIGLQLTQFPGGRKVREPQGERSKKL